MLKRDLKEEFEERVFRVAIFGSARIKKGELIYKQIEELTKMLGKRGIEIVTGGGPGLMEAANKGHKEGSKRYKNAHSIGLGIRLPEGQMFNRHLDTKKEFNLFSERLDNFMILSNAVVVAPGGIGTLLEFFYTWQLVQVKKICSIPIILFGEQWSNLVDWLESWPLKKRLISEKDLKLIFLTESCNEVFEIIDKSYKEYRKGRRNFCLNYKKYRIK